MSCHTLSIEVSLHCATAFASSASDSPEGIPDASPSEGRTHDLSTAAADLQQELETELGLLAARHVEGGAGALLGSRAGAFLNALATGAPALSDETCGPTL